MHEWVSGIVKVTLRAFQQEPVLPSFHVVVPNLRDKGPGSVKCLFSAKVTVVQQEYQTESWKTELSIQVQILLHKNILNTRYRHVANKFQ